MSYGIIYKVTFPNNKVYIGQTITTLEHRKKQHLERLDKEDYPFHRALKKYGVENTVWEQIDEADNASELDEKEVYWIFTCNACTKLGSKKCNGYNVDYGGNAHSHFTWLTCEELIQFGDDYRAGMESQELWEKYKYTGIPKERMMSLYNGRTYTIFTKIPPRDYIAQPKEYNLNRKIVLKIVEDFKIYGEVAKVAALNHVGTGSVDAVVKGETWNEITGIQDIGFYNKYYRLSSILTNDEIYEIAKQYFNGVTLEKIIDNFNTQDTQIINAIKNVYKGYNFSKITHIPKFKPQDKNQQVLSILEDYNNNIEVAELTKKYQVSESTIRNIINGRTCASISNLQYNINVKHRITEHNVEKIIKLHNDGLTAEQISSKIDVHTSTIYRFLRGETHKDLYEKYKDLIS